MEGNPCRYFSKTRELLSASFGRRRQHRCPSYLDKILSVSSNKSAIEEILLILTDNVDGIASLHENEMIPFRAYFDAVA